MPSLTHQPTDFLLRRKEVEHITALSRASIYRLINLNKFPRPVALGTGSVRWRQSDVVTWQSSLVKTGKDGIC
jgi:prophage regulatory protein